MHVLPTSILLFQGTPHFSAKSTWSKQLDQKGQTVKPLRLAESSYATHERSWWIWWICEKHISLPPDIKKMYSKGIMEELNVPVGVNSFLLGKLNSNQVAKWVWKLISITRFLIISDYINHVCMQIYIYIYIIYIIHVYVCTINLYCTMNNLHESVIDHSQVISILNMSKLV